MIERVAFFVFPGLTMLDFVGGYDALRRVPLVVPGAKLSWRIIGTQARVSDETGVALEVDAVYPALDEFDLLYVPGGLGTRTLMHDTTCIDYLRTWGSERPLASVCTGALLIGAAGHLAGLPATTHHSATALLAPLCGEAVTDRRVVDTGRVVTAGGVTSALDLGLHLVDKFWGADARRAAAAQMEWPL